MSQTVIAHYVEEGTIREGKFKIDTIPDSCPTCHKGIEPIKRFKWFEEKHLYLIFQCLF